jgi:TPR repeat protein
MKHLLLCIFLTIPISLSAQDGKPFEKENNNWKEFKSSIVNKKISKSAMNSWLSLCNGGSLKDCNFYAMGLEREKKKLEAMTFYSKACEGGVIYSCLKKLPDTKETLASGNEKKINDLLVDLQSNCAKDSGWGCASLAYFYKTAGKSYKSKTYSKKSCGMGNYSGCRLYRHFLVQDFKNKNIKYFNNICEKFEICSAKNFFTKLR